MKPFFLYALLALIGTLFISSCSKEKEFGKSAYGKWELKTVVSFYPAQFKQYATGNGNYLELTQTGTLNRYENGQLVLSTPYSIQNKKLTCTLNGKGSYWALVYDNTEEEIAVQADTLTLSTPRCWADGGVTTYVKVR
ncbi:hypothetical protein [Niabella soli]|uniref:Lipocalin-like domain-containing protein n=1 Tax=Niabella soli DSM 19437 TaxID=929713 RepID=W0F4I8_9BACT|nr:hypothetical protein [Niabella soli]AHF17990.1 hypothetical protein NIASO_18355 [Niabella soli DSM 19437]